MGWTANTRRRERQLNLATERQLDRITDRHLATTGAAIVWPAVIVLSSDG